MKPAARPAANAPRALHRLFARVFGYFWMPCARCGRYWGGHEPDLGRIVTERGQDGFAHTALITCCPGPDDAPISPDRMAAIERSREDMERGGWGDERPEAAR